MSQVCPFCLTLLEKCPRQFTLAEWMAIHIERNHPAAAAQDRLSQDEWQRSFDKLRMR